MVETCFICLKEEDLVENHYYFDICDKIQDIRCDCNLKCHYRCMKERIFDRNQGIQICEICNVEYSPHYMDEIEYQGFEFIKKILLKIFNNFYNLYLNIKYLLFILFFSYIFCFFIISSIKL